LFVFELYSGGGMGHFVTFLNFFFFSQIKNAAVAATLTTKIAPLCSSHEALHRGGGFMELGEFDEND